MIIVASCVSTTQSLRKAKSIKPCDVRSSVHAIIKPLLGKFAVLCKGIVVSFMLFVKPSRMHQHYHPLLRPLCSPLFSFLFSFFFSPFRFLSLPAFSGAATASKRRFVLLPSLRFLTPCRTLLSFVIYFVVPNFFCSNDIIS